MSGHDCFLPDEVDGADLLDNVAAFIRRFVCFPSDEALTAVTLWAAHTHAIDMFDNTPRLALLSPLPSSGKTRALEILELLVQRPVLTVNSSAAYLFRRVAATEGPPTLLFDEIDTGLDREAERTRTSAGLLNAGYRRGATANRCTTHGKDIVLAGLSCLLTGCTGGTRRPARDDHEPFGGDQDVETSPDEEVSPYRRRLNESEGERAS